MILKRLHCKTVKGHCNHYSALLQCSSCYITVPITSPCPITVQPPVHHYAPLQCSPHYIHVKGTCNVKGGCAVKGNGGHCETALKGDGGHCKGGLGGVGGPRTYSVNIQTKPPVPGKKIVCHKTGPWYQKGFGMRF